MVPKPAIHPYERTLIKFHIVAVGCRFSSVRAVMGPPHNAVNKILRECFEGIWTDLRELFFAGFKFYRI